MKIIEDDDITLDAGARGTVQWYECRICGEAFDYDNIDEHTQLSHGLIPYDSIEWKQKQRILR